MNEKEVNNKRIKGRRLVIGISLGILLMVAVIIAANMTFFNRGRAEETSQAYNEEYAKIERDTKLSLDGNGDLVITRNRVEENNADLDDSWTVLLYMTGTDIESDKGASTYIMNEICNANVNTENIKKLNFLVQTGGTKNWHSNYGSKDNLHRLKLTGNGDYEEIEKLPLASMGNPDTLADFINWGMTNYPAKKTMVILWDHGGPLNDLCYDELYNEDCLTINEVEYAFAKSKSSLKAPIDADIFHTCSNGTVEYANALAPYVNYMVISPTYTPTYGFDYKDLVNQMLSDNAENTKSTLGFIAFVSFTS